MMREISLMNTTSPAESSRFVVPSGHFAYRSQPGAALRAEASSPDPVVITADELPKLVSQMTKVGKLDIRHEQKRFLILHETEGVR